MTKILFSFLILTVLNITVFAQTGQVRLDAQVDRTTVAQDDNLTLTINLTSDHDVGNSDESPHLPSLTGFELLSQYQSQSYSSIFENGKFTSKHVFSYTYTLSPQKTGSLQIGSAEMQIDGQLVKTKPITITVVAAGSGSPRSNVARNAPGRGRGGGAQQPDEEDQGLPPGFDQDDNDVFSQLLRNRGFTVGPNGGIKSAPGVDNKEAFFVSVEVNKKRVYVGEELVATWHLYTRGSIQNFDPLKYPDLKGFWKEDLDVPTRLSLEQVNVNGVPYSRALLASYALFPIGAGKKTIDPYKAKATVIQMDSGMSMFGIGRPFTYTKVSQEVPIEVLPLPTEGRPASFSGAVGHFNITGSMSATQVKVNQPVSLKIRFSGQGNVKAIELPPLDLPKSLEVYDTKKESQFQKTGEGYKEFEILIIPRSQGAMAIPPIEVSYFDPKTAKYVSSKTPTFNLNVLPGDGTPNNFSSPMADKDKSENTTATNTNELRYLKTSPTLGFGKVQTAALWLALYLGLFLYFGWKIWKISGGGELSSTALLKKKVQNKLRIAREKLKAGDIRGVGVESSNAVISTLAEVTGVGGGSLTTEDMMKRLPSDTGKLQEQIGNFLSRCELISYAPKEVFEQARQKGKDENQELKKIITEAESIISLLFQVAKTSKSSEQGVAPSAHQ